jgi:hypothetical protein
MDVNLVYALPGNAVIKVELARACMVSVNKGLQIKEGRQLTSADIDGKTQRKNLLLPLSRESLQCFQVFLPGLDDDLCRQRRRRRRLVPVKGLQVVAEELFVE